MELIRIISKFKVLINSLYGYILKIKIDVLGLKNIKKLERKESGDEIVVSLTSYGRRVEKVVYYAIISMLKQTKRPNRIILWLDDNNWDWSRIPNRLKELTNLGLEIKFCEDIKSYKKLIPTLKICPNDYIVTIDDDGIYNKNLIMHLWNLHIENPKCVIGTYGLLPEYMLGSFRPYKTWNIISEISKSKLTFLVGAGGVLYPPGSLNREVLNEAVFKKLCPLADDIWFWTMEILNNTPRLVKRMKNPPQSWSFDNLYQYFHRGSALTHQNSSLGLNDRQLAELWEYYNLKGNQKNMAF